MRRAREVWRQRGPLGLLAATLRTFIIDHRVFLLLERQHAEWPAHEFPPALDQFEEQFINDNEQADRAALWRDDFRPLFPRARKALDAGAVAFCVYSSRKPVHLAWLATTPRARSILDGLGFQVPFEGGIAWTGVAWTSPEFRKLGLQTYGIHRRIEYLLDLGFSCSRAAMERNNRASIRANAHFVPRLYAVGTYWRVLGRRRWSERPPTSAEFALLGDNR